MNAEIVSDNGGASGEVAKHSIHDSFPFIVGGGVLGAVAAFFAATVYGLILAIANRLYGGEICGTGFSPAVIIFMSVLSGVLLVAVGVWLFRLRRWIGIKAAPEDVVHITRMRNRFTAGSMTIYCLLAPAVWLVATASANCISS